MQSRTKQVGRGGRPRKFNEGEALMRMQRQLWAAGFSGISLDGIARSSGLNRPSLAASFGGKDVIYQLAAKQYAAMMDESLNRALCVDDLCVALQGAFDVAIDIYTESGPNGCFVICTAPAESVTNTVFRDILDQSIEAIDILFLKRLEKEKGQAQSGRSDIQALAGILGSALQSIALRARAGWAHDRLRRFAACTVQHVVYALRHSSE